MALFATKYKTTIENWDGETIIAEIQEDGFSGTAQEFTPVGGNPIVIEHQCNVNLKESWIVPSQAKITVYVSYNWDLVELLYATDRQFKVIIKNTTDSRTLFTGWVIAGVNSEDYTTGRYMVEIQATDGLPDLRDIPYLDNGALYDEFQYPLQIIFNCMAATGLELSLLENIDIYAAAGMSTGSTNSPLNQSYIHTKAYGETIDDVMSCWEVLENVAQAFYCRFMQTSVTGGVDSNSVYMLSKIDQLTATKTYRKFTVSGSSYVYSITHSIAPLLTMGTDVDHVNGPGRISVRQGFKEVNLKGLRGQPYNCIENGYFDASEFATDPATTLNNWDALSNTKIVSSWSTPANNLSREDFNGQSALKLGSHTADHVSGPGGDPSVVRTGSKVRINATGHSITTSDWIFITGGDYAGPWNVVAVVAGTSFDINADYVSDQTVQWITINKLRGIETANPTPLGQDISLVDEDTTTLRVEINYNMIDRHYYTPVIVLVMARISGTDFKLLNNDGNWIDKDATNDFFGCIFKSWTESGSLGDDTIEVEASLSSDNNFYTSGSPELYIGLFSVFNLTEPIRFYNVRAEVISGADKETTTVIDTDFVESKEIDFFHTDTDGSDNDDYKFLNAIRDDATPKVPVNSWKQDGGTADNLEDLISTNLAAAYDENSQIWSGTIKGDIHSYNAIKDPLNFDRIFQIQRLSRNLVDNFCGVSMIENIPGGDLRAGSFTMATQLEFDKGYNNTDTETLTVTNNGNILLSLEASFSGNDDTYFNIENGSTFTIEPGETHDIEITVDQGAAQEIFVTTLTVSETRDTIPIAVSSRNCLMAHINTNSTIELDRGQPTNATILGVIGSGSIGNNTVGGTPIPTNAITINAIFNPSPSVALWSLSVNSISPPKSLTMRVRDSVTVYGFQSFFSSSSFNRTLYANGTSSPTNGYWNAAVNGWDGEDLYFELV